MFRKKYGKITMVTTPIKQEVKIRKKMFEVCGFPVVARVSETSRRDKEKWRRIFKRNFFKRNFLVTVKQEMKSFKEHD